jgi:hypothetical protein
MSRKGGQREDRMGAQGNSYWQGMYPGRLVANVGSTPTASTTIHSRRNHGPHMLKRSDGY